MIELTPEALEAEGFPSESVRICLANQERGFPLPSAIRHDQTNFLRIYADAAIRVEELRRIVTAFSEEHGCDFGIRPNGVKSISRIYQKFHEKSDEERIPIDILGCKLIANSLDEMYQISEKVFDNFDVRAYRDRIIQPQVSGYRDLQFVIGISGHPCELKIVHNLLNQLDKYEHKIYELARSIEEAELEDYGENTETPREILNKSQKIIVRELQEASVRVYREAWVSLLKGE